MIDFCLFACSDQFQLPDKGHEFVEIIQNLCQQLGIALTNFDYDSAYAEYDEVLSTEGRFDPDGIARLKGVLAEQPVCQLTLWSDYEDREFFDLHFELFDTEQFNGYKYAYVQFPMQHIDNLTSMALFSFVSGLVSTLNLIGQLDYAMVTTMDSALPATYFRDVFTTDLSDEEILNLATWKFKRDERKRKLRGLYWGNLLGPGHLARLPNKQTFMARLEGLIGGNRLTTIHDEALFFMLPSTDLSSDPTAASVATLLEEENLLILPDDRAREIVNNTLIRSFTKKK